MKKELRTKLRAQLAEIPLSDIQDRSRRAAQRLFAEPEYRRAEIMMIYLSLPHEADTTEIVLQAWQDRKKVVAPQVSWDSRQMVPVEIHDLDSDVASNQIGIREPIHGLPIPISLIVRRRDDEDGRLMVAISWNSDLGDAWEWAEQPDYPWDRSNYAFQLGFNLIVYAMTH